MIEVKSGAPTGRQAAGIAQKLRERAAAEEAVPLLLARYLAPQVREEIERIGVSYADATGNIMVSAIEPGFFLSDRGGDRDPSRSPGRPRGTLKGDPAARVVRALLDYSRSWKVRDLIAESGASTGATYRVLEYLDREGLADREEGLWTIPSWERLLRAWADDYNFLTENSVTRYIDPRGVEHFQASLQVGSEPYAVTGAAASRAWTSVAPVRSIFVYVLDAGHESKRWGIRPTDTGANVVLLEPRSTKAVAFERAGTLAEGIWRVAPAQVATDLLNGPGRDAQEAEELIRWMRVNENAWRLV
ncbi:hypothetical protein CQ040_10390 [Microbacterium sp. MYb54]|nr:hypothetical protein CQ032_17140 [Microbacterium sp. MYb43]PQZ80908.1 hypothetical protein CQ031_06270 [Microbacterium sp. MYb40]PRB20740.1 hypothetical protein CQ040_10390 [Microbacterium sp. MYb54]PRB31801.1 hypothetical protein CQ037_00055 [Microbacterium sp. MYb50]PRB61835.1 hypothetical protein CQ021_17485 [Microbacterium sp. MYb24]PRB67413.1 hypothetical protein CQ027_18430 [Microbacterium sp. MYb32]